MQLIIHHHHPASIVFLFLFLLTNINLITSQTPQTNTPQPPPTPLSRHLTIDEFSTLLSTDITTEIITNNTTTTTTTSSNTTTILWNSMTKHEWKRGWYEELNHANTIPFILCNNRTNASGYQKLREMMTLLNETTTTIENLFVLHNSDEYTCILKNMFVSTAAAITIPGGENSMVVHPVNYAMKLLAGTVETITTNNHLVNDTNIGGDDGDDNGSNNNVTMQRHRGIDVILCPGAIDEKKGGGDNDEDEDERLQREMESLAGIIRDRVRNGSGSASFYWTSNDDEDDVIVDDDDASSSREEFWSEAFSATSTTCDDAFAELSFNYRRSLGQRSLGTISISFDNNNNNDDDDYVATTTLNATTTSTAATECYLRLLVELTLLSETCAIQFRPTFDTMNVEAQWIIQSGVDGERPFFDAGLDGRGQVVAVSDTGLDLDNCYFWDKENLGKFKFGKDRLDDRQRKIIAYDNFVDKTDYTYGHGTHVCGTIVGHRASDGVTESNGAANGVAPNAKIAFIDIADADGTMYVPDAERLFSTGRPSAKIHSASWGSEYAGIGATGYSFDSYLYNNPSFFIAVAAGNSGTGNIPLTVGDPATAKNILSVGATNSENNDLSNILMKGSDYLAAFSSRGPTLDSRTKPDVVAPGHFILSAGALPSTTGECDPDGNVIPEAGARKEGLASFAGTSMATPAVAGSAALVRQYFEEGWYPAGERNEDSRGFNPSGALVKAVLMNGAQFLKGVDSLMGVTPVEPYDMNQNFGRVSLAHSLYLKGGRSMVNIRVWDRYELKDGEEVTFNVTINDKDCRVDFMSVTLVWTDPPAIAGCKSCLLNDIDLFVSNKLSTTASQNRTTVWHPNGSNHRDYRNNAERVIIKNVKPGEVYTLHVKSHNMVTASQEVALVATGCLLVSEEDGIVEVVDDDYVSPSADERKTLVIILSCLGAAVFAVFVGAVVNKFDERRKRQRREAEERDRGNDVWGSET